MKEFNLEELLDRKKKAAKEIVASEPEVSWDEKGEELQITLAFNGEKDGGSLLGRIKKLDKEKVAGTNDETFFYLDNIRVVEIAKGREIGVLLLEKLALELEKKNIKHLFGVARDENALRLFAKAFGKNNLVFYTSEYKPTKINKYASSIDSYLTRCEYIDFGVDLSRLEEKKEIPKKEDMFLQRKK